MWVMDSTIKGIEMLFLQNGYVKGVKKERWVDVWQKHKKNIKQEILEKI